MSDKLLKPNELQKRFKLDRTKLDWLIQEGVIENKEIFSEDDAEKIKAFRKSNPFTREELEKRFKIDRELFSLLIEKEIIGDRGFYNEAETGILKSFSKLRRLGYSNEACIKVLKEVGAPKDENLFENPEYIQLKNLSKMTEISERTIKFYEKSSIITKPRIYRNKRFYRKETAAELELIRDLQRLGYKLNSISSLLLMLRENNSESKKARDNLIEEIENRKKLADSIISKLKEYT